MTDSNTTPDKPEVLKRAYRKATSRLREEERDRFEVLMQQEAAKEGVEYIPSRVLREAKAREEIARLAAQHGIPVSFKVDTAEDAQRNVENLQAAYAHSSSVAGEGGHGPQSHDDHPDEVEAGPQGAVSGLYQHLRDAAVEAEERDRAAREEQA